MPRAAGPRIIRGSWNAFENTPTQAAACWVPMPSHTVGQHLLTGFSKLLAGCLPLLMRRNLSYTRTGTSPLCNVFLLSLSATRFGGGKHKLELAGLDSPHQASFRRRRAFIQKRFFVDLFLHLPGSDRMTCMTATSCCVGRRLFWEKCTSNSVTSVETGGVFKGRPEGF